MDRIIAISTTALVPLGENKFCVIEYHFLTRKSSYKHHVDSVVQK
jgi:hypothetical protein